MTGFFKDIPSELQDAVSIDGGTLLTFGYRVVLPLSTPGDLNGDHHHTDSELESVSNAPAGSG